MIVRVNDRSSNAASDPWKRRSESLPEKIWNSAGCGDSKDILIFFHIFNMIAECNPVFVYIDAFNIHNSSS